MATPTSASSTSSSLSSSVSSSLSSSSSSSSSLSSSRSSTSSSTASTLIDLLPTAIPGDPHHTTDTTATPGILLPTTSAAPASGGSRPDVYYLVLLGILAVLIVFAAALTIRGHRMRRRYRTATQLAIARGDPVSWWRDADASMSLHEMFRHGPPGPVEDWANVGSRKKLRRWVRIPILWDAEVEDPSPGETAALLRSTAGTSEKAALDLLEDYADDFDAVQPLTVHSLLPELPAAPPPPPAPGSPVAPTPALAAPPPPPPPPPPPTSVLGLLRYGFTAVPNYPSTPPPPPRREREANRTLTPNEPMRIAFMIQMPILAADAERERMARERERDDDDDEAGWRAGMELGVWEGTLDGVPPPSPGRSAAAAATPPHAPTPPLE